VGAVRRLQRVDQGVDLLATAEAGPSAIRGASVRLGGYGIGVAISTVSAAVLFRHLGVDASGSYILVLSLVTLSTGLVDAGLAAIAVRELSTPGGRAAHDPMMSSLLGLRITFTLVGTAISVAYALLAGFDETLIAGTLIVSLAMLLLNVQSALSSALLAGLALVKVAAIDLVRQASSSLLVIALAIAGAGLIPFFWTNVVGAAAALVITAVVVRGQIPLRPRIDIARWKALLREALPFGLAAAVAAVYFRLAILIVSLLSTSYQVGLFGASFRVIEVLIIVPQLAVSSALPIFARSAHVDSERLRYGLQRTFNASMLLGAAMALLLCVGALVVITVIAGKSFSAAVPVLRVHAIALLFSCMSALFGYALLSLRAYRALLISSVSALVTSAATALILVPDHGASGGAMATVVGEAVTVATSLVLLARTRGGMRIRFEGAPGIALAAALAAAPAFFIPALPATIAAAVIFLVVVHLVGGIPEEALVEARRLVRSRRAA
jgi:O-antigen/teichoic acid export membrane protein